MEPAIPLTAEMARATGGSTGRTSLQCLPESPDEDAPQAVSDLPVQTTTAASARPQRERQAPAHLRSGDWLLHVNQWVDTTLPSPPPPPPYIGRYEFQTPPPGQPSTLPTPMDRSAESWAAAGLHPEDFFVRSPSPPVSPFQVVQVRPAEMQRPRTPAWTTRPRMEPPPGSLVVWLDPSGGLWFSTGVTGSVCYYDGNIPQPPLPYIPRN